MSPSSAGAQAPRLTRIITQLRVQSESSRAILDMDGFVIQLMTLPAFPDNRQPAIRQASIGMADGPRMFAHLVPVSRRPARLRDRRLGPLLRNLAEFVIARLSKVDAATFATLLRHRTGAGETLDTLRIGEAFPVIAKLRQQGWREKVTRAGQGRE